MGRGRGRRYSRFASQFDMDGGEIITETYDFEIFSLEEDGVTPTSVNDVLSTEFIDELTRTDGVTVGARIIYDVNGVSDTFILRDDDSDISNGFQVFNLDSDIDIDRALNDLDYILEEDLIGLSTYSGEDFGGTSSSEDLSLDSAFDDSASTEAGQSIAIDVLANDLEVDDNGFEFSSSPSSSEGGTVEIENGQILFTPGEDFVGTDSFTYDLLSQDGQAEVIDTATVTVEVSEPEDSEDPIVSLEPIFGTLEGDLIEVEGNNQLIFAGDSNDLIDAFTGEGNNRIYAGSGDDNLVLGEKDRAFGGNGNDRFFFTAGGDNTVTGGEGVDQFWIATAEFPDAANTITDFAINEDVIGIAGLEIGFGDLALTQQGNDALIASNGNDLALLEDINITDLSEIDFTFV